MKTIKKNIEVVDLVEKLNSLDRELKYLPKPIGGRVSFKSVIDSIGDLISLADQYNVELYDPSVAIPYHWCIIDIGDNVNLHLESNKDNYKITY